MLTNRNSKWAKPRPKVMSLQFFMLENSITKMYCKPGLPVWPYYGQTPQIWPFWKVSGRKIFKEKVWPYFGLFSMWLANFYNVWPFPSFLAFSRKIQVWLTISEFVLSYFWTFLVCLAVNINSSVCWAFLHVKAFLSQNILKSS